MAEGKKNTCICFESLWKDVDKKPVKVVALDHENRVAGRKRRLRIKFVCVWNSLKFWIMWMYVIQNRNTSDRSKNPRNASE